MRVVAGFILILCLAFSSPTISRSVVNEDMVGRVNGSFFALSVAGVESLSAWYRDKLSLQIIAQGEAPNKIAKFAILQGNGLLIELIQHRDGKPRSVVAPEAKNAYEIQGIFKTGAIVDDLDHVYREAKAKGVTVAYELMAAKDVPMRSFSIRDAEGNLIQFFGK